MDLAYAINGLPDRHIATLAPRIALLDIVELSSHGESQIRCVLGHGASATARSGSKRQRI